MKRQLRHVIFLGAGASCTSGYPIGQDLRLQMSSTLHFKAEVEKSVRGDSIQNDHRACYHNCLKRFNDFEESVKLFRHGGFGTVDEFSKLASNGYQEHVQNMKKLMRVVLSLQNPEDAFHKSDYYPFIQRLFRDDQLDKLRSEITVITYNYDCYLDFLMLEAFRQRQKLSGSPQEVNDFWCNKLTSGFYNPKANGEWSSQTQGFNYYKLHGSIAFGNEPYFGHQALFQDDAVKRLGNLANGGLQYEVPPIVFPWELFDGSSGKFIPEDDFIFVKQAKDSAAKERAFSLFHHLKTIWDKAKRQVLAADKISFIGLSMHQYMEDGLAFLFEGKTNGVQVVVANPSNNHFKDAENRLHPSSICGRVAAIFRDITPNMKYVRSSSEDDGIFRETSPPESGPDPDVTPRYSFAEFIEREMA